MKDTSVYNSFEELDLEIKIAKLERRIAEEKFKRGIHLVQEQFQPEPLKYGVINKLSKQLVPLALEWGLNKLRNRQKSN